MRNIGVVLVAALALVCRIPPAAAQQDPNHTATVYVHGFESSGADRQGTYGETIHPDGVDSIAARAGLPVAGGAGSLPPNVVAAVSYYGDSPPSYYSPADLAEVDRVTSEWGGGVPRYAAIVARYARHVMEESGATQVNFVSASFGSLIVRWLIEKDVGGLAGEGRIARWLSAEGLLAGNWAASQDDLVGILDALEPQPIDVEHMSYDWVATHLHSPRGEADDPSYARILIGQLASTDDGANGGALTAAMAALGAFQPNDGVQALGDARFGAVTSRSRFHDRPPTLSLFHVDHYGLVRNRGAWAQAAAFLTQRRRVTVTMTSARVTDLHEPQTLLWDWRPAEVVFESRVYSPAAEARWRVIDPVSSWHKAGASAPLRRFARSGDTQTFTHVLFDDLVLDEETALRLELDARELDYDPRYGVLETFSTPYDVSLGGGSITVSAMKPGTYTFQAAGWSATLAVAVYEYPFARMVGVADEAPAVDRSGVRVLPNPHPGAARVLLSGAIAAPRGTIATLAIFDLHGRRVRTLRGDPAAGIAWDGRDDRGTPLEAGVYLHRVSSPGRTSWGRSCLIR